MGDTKTERFADMILRRPLMRHLSGGLAAAGIAGALSLVAADAEAQDPILTGQAGTYVGCSWGGGGAGVTWGFEGRVGGDFRDPYQPFMDPFFTTSAVARLGFVGVDPGVWVGAQAGGANGIGSFVAELTLGYQWGDYGGFSLPIGLGLDVYLGSTFVRGDPVLGTIAFGGGLVAPPRFLQPMAIAGRALHDEEGHAALPTVEALGEQRADAALGPDLSNALRQSWEQRAKAEWASVPAFLQLADQLRVAGAPDALVARAHRAADDELRHAVATARASMRYGGAPVRIGRVTPATRPHAEGRAALTRLAVEGFVDGCLGEGKAAAAVAREAELAPDAELVAMQRSIASDEARHAELAWDVIRWTLDIGGDDVRHALASVRDARPSEASSGVDEDVDLTDHGLLSEDAHQAIGERVARRATARLDQLVG